MGNRHGALTPILLGVWFGLVGGGLEVVVIALSPIGERWWLFWNAQLAWMPAAAYAVLFGLLGLLLAPLALAWPWLLGRARLAALFSTLVWLDVVWLQAPPHDIHAVLIATFLGLQTGRLVRRWEAGFSRLVAWSLPLLVVAPPAAWLGIELGRERVEARAWARPATKGQPNVLLLVPDAVRAYNLSAYGYVRPTTPTLERLAARGVRFERAVVVSPWTLPSVAGMFTGRWLHEQKTGWFDGLDERWPTLAEQLGRAGYVSAGFVTSKHLGRGSGLARGFAHYEDYPVSWPNVFWNSMLVRRLWRLKIGPWHSHELPVWSWRPRRASARTMSDHFLAWHASRRGPNPWFAYLQPVDPHPPMRVPPQYGRLFRDESTPPPPLPQRLPPDLPPPEELPARRPRPEDTDRFDRALRYFDDEVGRLLAELERRGDLANTIVIVTSDHGQEFGEHGIGQHGDSLYYPALRVPLIMAGAGGIPPGRSVPALVSLRDLPATVVDLVGLRAPSPFPGASLARHWRPGPAPRPDPLFAELNYAWNKPAWIPISKGDMTSVLLGTHHLIRRGDGREELYDVVLDPWEQTDRVADVALLPVVAELSGLLDALPPLGRRRGPTDY